MKRNEATRAAAIPPTLDSLIEDVFGLNLRGLKTLGQLFAAPKVVFESARVADWHNRYTPTIRLTFSIITVFMLLSFFWAAEDGVFYQSILAQLEDAAASNPDMPPPEQVLESYFAAYSVAYPFVYMFIHTLIASVVWLWGRGTGWVARVRLYFGLLAVGMIIALLSMIFMPLIEREMLSIYMLIVMGIGFLAYVATYMRAMRGNYPRTGLGVRALAIATIIPVGDIVVAIAAGVASSVWISISSM